MLEINYDEFFLIVFFFANCHKFEELAADKRKEQNKNWKQKTVNKLIHTHKYHRFMIQV